MRTNFNCLGMVTISQSKSRRIVSKTQFHMLTCFDLGCFLQSVAVNSASSVTLVFDHFSYLLMYRHCEDIFQFFTIKVCITSSTSHTCHELWMQEADHMVCLWGSLQSNINGRIIFRILFGRNICSQLSVSSYSGYSPR